MKRKVSFSKDKLYAGVETLALAVGSTLGPKGRPVLIEDMEGHPYLTKDGVTVANNVQLVDQEENLGARLVAQAAQSTVKAAGDGTTTSTVLAHAIIGDGTDDVDYIKGIDAAAKDVVKHLEEVKKDLGEDLIKHIAYISTNNDEELSEIITEAFVKTGEDGIVDVQYNPNKTGVELEIKAGSYMRAGLTHQHFITNMRQRTCELDRPMILVSNATLHELGQIEHILRTPVTLQRPIIIIGDFEKNFCEAFVANVEKGNIKGCLIEPGNFVNTDMLRDLAQLVGAKFFDNANGNNFDYLSDNYWGEALQATIGPDFTLFSLESNDHMQKRAEELKELIEEDKNNASWYKESLSMLNGQYATIAVGAPTQAQAFEIKDRLDDAVFAVGAAQKFGYLPGGGVALKDAANAIKRKKQLTPFDAGYNHLLGSLFAPMAKICENAGLDADYGSEEGYGVDASNGEKVNMEEAGIIDPAFVSIQAVINATSAATALLSAKATLIKANED